MQANFLISLMVVLIQLAQSNSIFFKSGDQDEALNEHGLNNRGPKYFCQGKEDDSQHEHFENCHKYWHCLYVGTIFETALERKCPVGTMFHPILRKCEISTFVSALSNQTLATIEQFE